MNNGDDTAFYLAQGYRVVAIEADPTLAEEGRKRFAREIQEKRLMLLNVGVAAEEGTAQFWICDRRPEWNSFDRRIASRNGEKHHAVNIPTVRFAKILAEQGLPYYLKIDIEGNDPLCVNDLVEHNAPSYVSVECECTGSDEETSQEPGLESLALLAAKGYRRFKLVDQDHLVPLQITSTEEGRSRDRSTRWQQLKRKIARKLAPRFSAPVRQGTTLAGEPISYRFAAGSSGTWGEDIPGPWLSRDEAAACYLQHRTQHFASGSEPAYSFWCDWHATV
jgi:FkbM family methyltransferase